MDHEEQVIQSKTITVGRHIVRIEVHRIPFGWRFLAKQWGKRDSETLLSVASQDLFRGLSYTQRRLEDEFG